MINLFDNWPYFAVLLALLTIKGLWCCGFDWAFFKETIDFVIKVTGYFCLGFIQQIGSVLIPMIEPLNPDQPWCGSMLPCLEKSCLEAQSRGRQFGLIALIILSVIAAFVVFAVTLGSIRNWFA